MSRPFARRWERALEAVLEVDAMRSRVGTALESLACEVDLLERQLVEDSREMALRLERFASDVERGEHASDPTGYSTLRDVTQRAAKLEVKREAFRAFLRASFGDEIAKGFAERMRAAREAETKKDRKEVCT